MQVLISNTSCIMAYTITTSYLVLYVGPECFWCLHSCVMWLVSMWLVNSFTLDAYMGVASKICLWWTCFFPKCLNPVVIVMVSQDASIPSCVPQVHY
jgi:hypothetical protein